MNLQIVSIYSQHVNMSQYTQSRARFPAMVRVTWQLFSLQGRRFHSHV